MTTNIDEEIVYTNKSGSNRFQKWVNLVSAKFELGKVSGGSIKGSDGWWTVFGPIKNKAATGLYLHLISTPDKVIGVKTEVGSFKYFKLSKSKARPVMASGSGVFTLLDTSEELIRIPKDVVKAEHLFLLAINSEGLTEADVKTAVTEAEHKIVFDINKRFEMLVKLTRMVGNRASAGMIVTGSGGLGKTYTILDTFKKLGLVMDEDFAYLKGAKLTPVTFYKYLFDNADRIIIFDDSDVILDNPDVQNMLKSALDTSGVRSVTYMSVAIENEGYPTTFAFPGQIIFIANRSQNQINQALLSRSLYVDVSMTRPEALERMSWIVNKGVPEDVEVSWDSMKIAFKLLQDFVLRGPGKKAELPRDLNMRTLIKAAVIVEANPGDYDDLIYYVFSQ